jgi:tetratricopeptide (TPR) repeat protein
LRLLEEAVARDPYFALAYCLISRFHGELYWFGYDRTRSRLTQAKIAADRAMHLQPDSSDVRLALAYYYYFGYRDYELAHTELAIAHAAAPNDAEAWDASGAINRRQGRWEEALSNFEKARELDPRNPSVLWNLADTYACLGRNDEAVRSFAKGIEVNPEAHFFSVEQAAIPLRSEGDIAPLRAVLREIPGDFDPGGGITNIAVRVSLMDRDYDGAERLLKATRYERFHDIGVGGPAAVLDGYTFPRAWYEGLIALGRSDIGAADRAFAAAQKIVEADLTQSPDDAKLVAMLGLVHSMKGRHEDAITAGQRAVELLPISRDAYDGPLIATKLAVIYAAAGQSDRAIELLKELITIPNGPTPGTLRAECDWDRLRSDPRFEKLMGT